MHDSNTGRFLGRDPIGYVDGQNLFANYYGCNGSDPSGMRRWGCTSARMHCTELRNLWYNQGKTFTAALFDLFLSGAGCRQGKKDKVNGETLLPGITSIIQNSPEFQNGVRRWTNMGPCAAGSFKGYFKMEYLTLGRVIDNPFDDFSPLIHLPDYAYAVGTVRVYVNGNQEVERKGCCCTRKLNYDFSATDRFSFHTNGLDFLRTINFGNPFGSVLSPGWNPFASYYEACAHLQENCDGYCPVRWNITGSGRSNTKKCWHKYRRYR